jgi:hypothetical protein
MTSSSAPTATWSGGDSAVITGAVPGVDVPRESTSAWRVLTASTIPLM